MTDKEKERLVECIPSGRENAATAGSIGRKVGLNREKAQKQLGQLMCNGEWICVTFSGGEALYFLPESRKAFEDAFTQLHKFEIQKRRELRTVKEARKRMQSAIEHWRGRGEINDVANN